MAQASLPAGSGGILAASFPFSKLLQGKAAARRTSHQRSADRRVRDSQSATTLSKSRTHLNDEHKETIARDLRAKVSTVGIAKESIPPSIVANIRTSDVKEQSTSTSVVRLKITLKEEGLEWSTQVGTSGGVVHTLQPE